MDVLVSASRISSIPSGVRRHHLVDFATADLGIKGFGLSRAIAKAGILLPAEAAVIALPACHKAGAWRE